MVEKALARTRPFVKVATEIIRTKGDHEHVTPSEVEGARGSQLKDFVAGFLGPSQTGVFAREDRKKRAQRIFTAELERALMEKRIDVAVHSAKDFPSEMDNALTITAVLPRGAVEDLLLRKSTAHASVATIATEVCGDKGKRAGVIPPHAS